MTAATELQTLLSLSYEQAVERFGANQSTEPFGPLSAGVIELLALDRASADALYFAMRFSGQNGNRLDLARSDLATQRGPFDLQACETYLSFLERWQDLPSGNWTNAWLTVAHYRCFKTPERQRAKPPATATITFNRPSEELPESGVRVVGFYPVSGSSVPTTRLVYSAKGGWFESSIVAENYGVCDANLPAPEHWCYIPTPVKLL